MPSIYKKTDDTTYALGKTLVFELLKFSPKQCTCVYISDKTKKDESFAEIERLCKENNIGICLSNKIFNKLSDKENCYVIAEFKKWNGKIDVNGNHIVLVNPANTGNLGTIMRAALGFGIYDIALIGSSVDEFDPKTIRASMGSIFSLNIEHFNEYSDYSKKVSENRNIYPFMLKATTNLKNVVVDNNKKWSLIFGNESTGLDDSFLKIGEPLIIKHTKNIDSLNVSVSVAIALFYFTDFKN